MNTPAKTLVTMAQCSSCGRWLLSLWERPLQCCAWGAVAFGGDGGALVPSAIAATRCKRPSVESCRDCGYVANWRCQWQLCVSESLEMCACCVFVPVSES